MEGKLLVSNAKRRQVEIKDILTWTEAFTIFQLVLCATFPLHWLDLTKYKLLIIQTARQHPGLAWLEYDLAFRRDAAASGLNDWSKMNLDLYNFHLHSSTSSSLLPRSSSLSGLPQSSSGSLDSRQRTPFCHSWNEGNASGLLGGAGFATSVAIVKESIQRLTAPFPTQLDVVPTPPPLGGRKGQY